MPSPLAPARADESTSRTGARRSSEPPERLKEGWGGAVASILPTAQSLTLATCCSTKWLWQKKV
eukprot:8169150-Alexandrium_andersonii.AAC.1